MSTARIHDFAGAVTQVPAFQLAQEILLGESPEFALRKALELASIVLSPHHRAAQDLEEFVGIAHPGIRAK